MGAAIDRDAIDGVLLRDVVSQALGSACVELEEWDCRPLAYDVKSLVAQGVYRLRGRARSKGISHPWSVVLKIVRDPAGLEAAPGLTLPEDEAPPTNFFYWKREVVAYQSGVLDDLPPGLAAPRCFAVVEAAPRVFWLWLEDLGAPPQLWTLDRYRETAHHLGRWNGAYLAGRPLPPQPWLHYDWLASLVGGVGPVWAAWVAQAPPEWGDPLLRVAVARPTLERIERLRADAPLFLAALERLPRTLCHRDAFPANLFERRGADGQPQAVAIDWAFVGVGAIGEELAPLITMRARPAGGIDRRQVEEVAIDGYMAGLQEAGWSGDIRVVRLGYAATAPLRYSLMTAGALVLAALQDNGLETLAQQRQQPIEWMVEQDAAFITYLLDLADDARTLLPLVDVP